MPTEQPFLYTVSVTATDGAPLASVESVLLEELDRVRQRRASPTRSSSKAKAQLRARLVFDSDSVTNIAHQLGYFETIASVDLFTTAPARIAAVTLEEVAAAARAVLHAGQPHRRLVRAAAVSTGRTLNVSNARG